MTFQELFESMEGNVHCQQIHKKLLWCIVRLDKPYEYTDFDAIKHWTVTVTRNGNVAHGSRRIGLEHAAVAVFVAVFAYVLWGIYDHCIQMLMLF